MDFITFIAFVNINMTIYLLFIINRLLIIVYLEFFQLSNIIN